MHQLPGEGLQSQTNLGESDLGAGGGGWGWGGWEVLLEISSYFRSQTLQVTLVNAPLGREEVTIQPPFPAKV